MGRRGNCHDKAVAESFFQLLKRERIRRCTSLTREAARQDVFEHIEMFYNPEASMSRRDNCHENAVAESFFQLLKRERIRRHTYLTRDAARQDVFDSIEMFNNPKRKHTNNGMLSPVDFEIRQRKLNGAGV